VRTSKSLFTFFDISARRASAGGDAICWKFSDLLLSLTQFLRGENLEVSAYFFCLDAKKVTKKDQGYVRMAKNGRVSPAQKNSPEKVFTSIGVPAHTAFLCLRACGA